MITSIASHLRSSLGAGRRVRAWLRRLFVLWLVLFLAACVGAAPTTSPAPAAVPPAAPTATATPAPTATPALAAWAPAPSVPATAVLVRGGAALARRALPAAELAQRLGAVGGGWRLLADDAGQIGFYAGAGGALVLAQGPAGYAWDAAAQVWVRGAAIVIPDVWAPGGGAMPPAEAAFLFADGGGALRVGVVYGPAAPAAGLTGAGAAVVRLPDGATLYVVEPVTAELAAGQALERDGAGDLRLLNPDGSYWRRITSWADVRAADEVHQAGAFAGPLSFWPDVPYAPVSWVAEDKAVYSFDQAKQEATVKDQATGQIIALARKNDKGAWEWKRVEPTLALKPAAMTKDLAVRFLAGGEMMTDEQLKAFEGRVFKDEKSGITIVLSRDVFNNLVPIDRRSGMNQQEINKQVIELLKRSEWGDLLIEIEKNISGQPNLSNVFFVTLMGGKPILITIKPEENVAQALKRKGSIPINEITRAEIFYYQDSQRKVDRVNFPRSLGGGVYSDFAYQLNLDGNDGESKFVGHDGYQARWIYDLQTQSWRPILPHERRGGEYELLTPEQRIKAIAKQYGTQYGFTNPDGSIKQEAVKILYDAHGKPSVILLVEGKNGAPGQYGLNPALNNPQVFEKAWQRLNEVDPDIASLLTRVYGLKLIGGDLGVDKLTFSEGREFYMASYSPERVEINEIQTKNPSVIYAIATILQETRAIAHDYGLLSTDSTLPYWARSLDPNSGVDKGNFVLRWIEENKSRLTSQEIKDLTEDSNFVIKWYEQNAKK